jgi:hypothetical protein
MTNEDKLRVLLRAPWTVTSAPAEDGASTVLRIGELPAFVVVGGDPEEVVREFWLALESLLESYIDAGEEPPLPSNFRDAWEHLKLASTDIHLGQSATVSTQSATLTPSDRAELVGT